MPHTTFRIYSFAGELLAASNNNLWDGALDSSQTDGIWDRPGFETGEEGFGGYQSVWSGTTSGGDINPAGKYLGTRVWNTDGIGGQVGYLVAVGRADRLNNWIVWFDNGIQSVAPRGGEFDTTMPRLYGLSDPIGLFLVPTGALFILR